MNKKFFKLSLTLNVIFALVAVGFSLIFYFYSTQVYEGESFLNFLFYVKTFFDLLAVFVGYTTIIYAFSQFDFKNGLLSIGVFSISFLISFVFQVVGSIIDNTGEFTVDFFVYVIYYSFGQGFITQMVPALVLALITYKLTKNGTQRIKSFFSWTNSIQKVMLVGTLVIFGLNLISHTGFTMLPNLITELNDYGSITHDHLTAIIVSYVEICVFYLVMQYTVYYFMYKIYHGFVLNSSNKKETI
ncbi:MAG: hypothetical protein J6D23_01580 [Clostridia bacterium]|nr:hypothetical protein [Clostridia bacterium]